MTFTNTQRVTECRNKFKSLGICVICFKNKICYERSIILCEICLEKRRKQFEMRRRQIGIISKQIKQKYNQERFIKNINKSWLSESAQKALIMDGVVLDHELKSRKIL